MLSKSWFKARLYPHITDRANIQKDVERLVKNPVKVAKHAFVPFIHKKIPVRRYKIIGYTETGKPIRGHKEIKDDKIKSTKKLRPIHYTTHIDAHIYAYYSNEIIQKKYELLLARSPELSQCITAYRRIPTEDGNSNKSNIHFAKEVFDYIKDKGRCCALAFDIESFFSNLDHKILKKAWTNLLGTKALPEDHYNIYKSITNYSYILLKDLRKKNSRNFDEKRLALNRQKGVHAFFESLAEFRATVKAGDLRIYKTQYHNNETGKNRRLRGIPQGLPISAMLANLYLLEFDKKILQKVETLDIGLYRRYSDDIVVVCSVEQKDELQNFVFEAIKEFNLDIAKSKIEVCIFDYVNDKLQSTKIVHGLEKPNFPFRYLGFEFYGDKTLIKATNLSNFYRRMKGAIVSKLQRLEQVKAKYLYEQLPIFKRKLYRIYTSLGATKRELPTKITEWKYDALTRRHLPKVKEKTKKFRGNFFSYIHRAEQTMNEPAIKRQMRRHWKILKNYFNKKTKIDIINPINPPL